MWSPAVAVAVSIPCAYFKLSQQLIHFLDEASQFPGVLDLLGSFLECIPSRRWVEGHRSWNRAEEVEKPRYYNQKTGGITTTRMRQTAPLVHRAQLPHGFLDLRDPVRPLQHFARLGPIRSSHNAVPLHQVDQVSRAPITDA